MPDAPDAKPLTILLILAVTMLILVATVALTVSGL
jgi:hypothetical protein